MLTVYEDAQGNVTGGGDQVIQFVPAGGQTSFEIPVSEEFPAGRAVKTEVFAQLSDTTLVTG